VRRKASAGDIRSGKRDEMKSITIREIASVLQSAKTIAVVGASGNPSRDSYSITSFLLRHRYNVIPVNPNYDEILGLKCYPSLLDIAEDVDIVDVFRRPEDVPSVVEDAISKNAGMVWMQPGAFNAAAAERAEAAGLKVVADRCIKVDYISLLGS